MLLQQNFTKRRHQKWFACKPGKCTLDQIYGHPLIYNGFGHCKKKYFQDLLSQHIFFCQINLNNLVYFR